MKSKRSLSKNRGKICLNCDRELSIDYKFCPNCGQLNSVKKIKFSDFFAELFSGLFAYDSRFVRTMRVLIFKPGKISKDYISGKRMRYVNPYRFFLTSAILFFLFYGYNTSFDHIHFPEDEEPFKFENNEAQPKGSDAFTATSPSQIDSLRKEKPDTYKNYLVTQEELKNMTFTESLQAKISLFNAYVKETKNDTNASAALRNLQLEDSAYNRWLYKKAVDFNFFLKNPQLFFNYLIGKFPFIIFLFLPIFTLFLSLLYIRSPFNYMEHLTFTFHIQSFFFILYTLALMVDFLIQKNVGTPSAHVIFVIYLYMALRKFYQQGKLKTAVKFMILNIIFSILAVITGLISVFGFFAFF